ncbi:MAG: methylenetetrahydrofolate reductase, partial [Ilumatobacteraceae bacterium]
MSVQYRLELGNLQVLIHVLVATELVELIASLGNFSIGVAAFPEGHPESPDLEHDARVLAMKQDAGAEFAITQLC